MIGIYHSKDLDGLCSGAIILLANPACKMIGWDYGQPIPEIDGTEEVVMADISFPMEEMLRLTNLLGEKLTIIDHHKRFIDSYLAATEDLEITAICNLETTKSACELAWEHFFPGTPTPEWIILLSKYDIWKGAGTDEWDLVISPFQYGMRSLIKTIYDFSKELPSIDAIIEKGNAILTYVVTTDNYNLTHSGFEILFKGYRTLCVNVPGVSTDTFKSVYNPEKHDLMMGFNYTGKFWKVSLRSVKPIDCSLLASEYPGGGGHFAAAGFEVADINEIIKQ